MKDGGTPWHAQHIAERYSLFALIAMGEGVVGTIAVLSAVVAAQGWSVDAAVSSAAGVGLTFAMWWLYYLLPSGSMLQARRERAFVWGSVQMIIVVSNVATGAGLEVVAHFIEHKSRIGSLPTVLTAATPVALFVLSLYALYCYMMRQPDRLHKWLLLTTAGVIAASVVLALTGAGMAICLVMLMLAPAVTVVGCEVWGTALRQRRWRGWRWTNDSLATQVRDAP